MKQLNISQGSKWLYQVTLLGLWTSVIRLLPADIDLEEAAEPDILDGGEELKIVGNDSFITPSLPGVMREIVFFLVDSVLLHQQQCQHNLFFGNHTLFINKCFTKKTIKTHPRVIVDDCCFTFSDLVLFKVFSDLLAALSCPISCCEATARLVFWCIEMLRLC